MNSFFKIFGYLVLICFRITANFELKENIRKKTCYFIIIFLFIYYFLSTGCVLDGDVNANLLALRFNEDSEFECMKKLIAKGADCCAKDSWNYTPLMYAVKGSAPKAIKAVKFIINKNAATLNAKNYFQTTALELAGKL